MLKKLLYYDLKWCIKVVIIYYGLAFVFACIGRLLEITPDTTFWNIVVGICKGIGLSLAITGLVNCIIRMWVRMGINMYKDESYLTHTLPIDIRLHFLSKFLATVIMILSSIIIILICVLIMYANKESIETFKNMFNILSNSVEGSIAIGIILVILTILAEFIFIVMVGFLGIVIGHRSNTKKALKSVLIGIGTYFGCNSITGVGMILGALFSTQLYSMLFEQATAMEYTFLCMLLFSAFLIYSVYIVIIYLIINRNLQKGVNID